MERIDRLVGVYDADGTVLGELSYVVGHLFGRRSCALCDITHGALRRRPEFDAAAGRLGVPFDLVHRDERSPALAAATSDTLPCVVAQTQGNHWVLLGPEAVAACGKDPAALVDAIRLAAGVRGLELATA